MTVAFDEAGGTSGRAGPAKAGLFRRSTVRVRLTLAFSMVAVLLVAIAGVGTWQLSELNRVAATSLRAQRMMGQWFAEIQANAVRTVVLTRTADAGLRQMLAPEMDAATQRIAQLQKEVEGLPSTPRSRALFEQIGARRASYLDARQRVLDRRQAGQPDEAAAPLDTALLAATGAYVASIEALLDFHGGDVAGDAATARAAAFSGQGVLLAVSAVGIVLGFIFSWKVTSAIVRPIRFTAKLARQVAGGDLTVKVRAGGGDEIAQMLQALSDMTADLRTLVGEVSGAAEAVTGSSARIAQGNLDLSQRTEQQVWTLEQTASAMEGLTSTVAQNARHASRVSLLAVSASEVARKGGVAVGQVVDTMTDISDSSRRIADIIGVIDGIAFQTNILALNAAVEAARAGEQGRGFAVVAAEVRGLAQRSAEAAKEIKGLIGKSAEKVEAGARLVDAAGNTMEEIVSSVREVTDLVAEIAAASQEQGSGIAQVNTALARMEQVLQQNAALVSDAATATEAMNAQAGALLQTVARFKLGSPQGDAGTSAADASRKAFAPAPEFAFADGRREF